MGNNSTKPAGGPPSPISSFNTPSKKEPKSPSSHNHANTSAQQKYPQLENQPLYSSTSSPSHRQKAEDKMGNDQSKQSPYDGRKKERSRTSGKSTPVRVPRGSDPRRQRGPDSQFESSGPPRDPNYIPHSDLNFPPRLPLPIEEEVHAPYSPTITAEGFSSPLHEGDIDGPILRQSSAISNTTLEDDEEMGNELQPYPYEAPPKGTVPTLLQWTQGGEKVFVTGTFARWNIKFRMVRDLATGYLQVVLQLQPGTHHVKFIVDGEMQLSNDLPTAVDHTNILVNYVEVSADDIPKDSQDEYKAPEGVHPPQVLHQGTVAKDHAPDPVGKTQLVDGEPKVEPVFWGKSVPMYLHDVDFPEQSRRYQRAARGVAEFSTPPGLPLFLGKSILNGTAPMKDDSSVLNMPNHTVLNHLATSSIKNDVLATSITTRYKRKYVTTIVYKPTEM